MRAISVQLGLCVFMRLCVGAHLLLHIYSWAHVMSDCRLFLFIFSLFLFSTLRTVYTCLIRTNGQSKTKTIHSQRITPFLFYCSLFRGYLGIIIIPPLHTCCDAIPSQCEYTGWQNPHSSCPDRTYLHRDVSLHCRSAGEHNEGISNQKD